MCIPRSSLQRLLQGPLYFLPLVADQGQKVQNVVRAHHPAAIRLKMICIQLEKLEAAKAACCLTILP